MAENITRHGRWTESWLIFIASLTRPVLCQRLYHGIYHGSIMQDGDHQTHLSPSVILLHPTLCRVKPEEMEHWHVALYKCYDASQQALDLQKLHVDPGLADNDVDMFLKLPHWGSSKWISLSWCFWSSAQNLHQLDGLCDIIEKASKSSRYLRQEERAEAWRTELEGHSLCSTSPHSPNLHCLSTCPIWTGTIPLICCIWVALRHPPLLSVVLMLPG